MGMMIVRHKVRDYGQWRPIFDGHVEMQRAAGLINPRVYHSADSNKSESWSSSTLRIPRRQLGARARLRRAVARARARA
jgi:hypothetical protein